MTAWRVVQVVLVNLALTAMLSSIVLLAVERSLSPASGRIATLTRSEKLGWDTIRPYETISPAGETSGDRRGPRFVFLGDSFTYEMRWPRSALERIRKDLPDAQGANLGVPGFGTYQELLKLRAHFAEIEPRAVVLLVFAWNDLRDNFPCPGIFYNTQMRDRPYWGEGASSASLPRFVLDSKIYERFLLRVTQPLIDRKVARRGIDHFAEGRERAVVSYDDIASWAPFYDPAKEDSPYVSGAWVNTEAVFRELKSFLDARATPLIVIGVDNALTVDRDVHEDWVVGTGLSEHFDVEQPLRRLGESLETLGVRYVNALPALRSLPGKVYTGAPGHVGAYLGPEGEEKLAELVAAEVLSLWAGAGPGSATGGLHGRPRGGRGARVVLAGTDGADPAVAGVHPSTRLR